MLRILPIKRPVCVCLSVFVLVYMCVSVCMNIVILFEMYIECELLSHSEVVCACACALHSVCLSVCLSVFPSLSRCVAPLSRTRNRSTHMGVCLELHALCKRICMGYTRIRVCVSENACVSIYMISVCVYIV